MQYSKPALNENFCTYLIVFYCNPEENNFKKIQNSGDLLIS